MQLPVIKSYHPKIIALSEHHFFILSKGLNAGKPLDQPCPNCFVAYCNDKTDRQFFYWLTYALWQCGTYKICLVGSVIPFLRISDLKHCLWTGYRNASTRIVDFHISVGAMQRHYDEYNHLIKLMKHKHLLLQKRLHYLVHSN